MLSFLSRRVICAVAGASLGCAAHAQPQPASLAAAVESAWQRTAVSAEARGLIRRVEAERTAAEAPWAAPPSLDIGHRTGRLQSSTGARESEVGIVVPLWLPGQRAARLAVSDADAAVAEFARADALLEVAGEVRRLLWEIARSRSEVALLQDQEASLQTLADDVDRRVRAGDLARADALAARGELLGARSQVSQAAAGLQAAIAGWTALTGSASVPPTGEADVEAGSAPASLEDHPAVRLAAEQAGSARRRVELAEASRRNPPEVVARLRQEDGGRPASSTHNVGIAVRIPFATADRNRPLLAAALSDLDTAEARERQRRAQIEAAARTALAVAEAAEAQLETERQRAALLSERADLVMASFRAGETSLPELLRATGAARQAQAGRVRQQAAFGLARARVQQSHGVLP